MMGESKTNKLIVAKKIFFSMIIISISEDKQWVTVCLDDGTTAVIPFWNKWLR